MSGNCFIEVYLQLMNTRQPPTSEKAVSVLSHFDLDHFFRHQHIPHASSPFSQNV